MTSHFVWASRTTPLQNRGRNFVRSKRRLPYMSRDLLLIFCVLTIRKHLLKMRFERSGRGQEPSRGHKFSILENFLSIRDFTSAMRPHFRSPTMGCIMTRISCRNFWKSPWNMLSAISPINPHKLLRRNCVNLTQFLLVRSKQGLGQARPNKMTSEMRTHCRSEVPDGQEIFKN